MQKRLTHIIVGSSFFLFFAAQFVIYPLNHSLIGNTDAIAHISIFHDHINNVKDAFGLVENGYIFYPANGVTAYVEGYLVETLIFSIPSLLGLDDIWSTFFLISVLFSLNAFTVYLLVNFYTDNKKAAFLAGILFSASSYMWSGRLQLFLFLHNLEERFRVMTSICSKIVPIENIGDTQRSWEVQRSL